MSNHKLTITVISAVIAVVATLGIVTSLDVQEVQATSHIDAMDEIKDQIDDNIGQPNSATSEVQAENIAQAEHLIFGKPVILDTNGVTATQTISTDYDTMVTDLKDSLLDCASGSCDDSIVQAQAKELADRTTYWQEIKATLEDQTRDINCDPSVPTSCVQLDKPDEYTIAGTLKTIGTDAIWDGWHREIRGPYFPLHGHASWNYAAPPIPVFPDEAIIATGPLGLNECSTVIKEIQGIKSIMRPIQIPIWQEPWASRASIIGTETVWVVEWVPAEFIKNLNYCNNEGSINFSYDINVIIERELLHFWNYIPGGYAGPGGAVPPGTR